MDPAPATPIIFGQEGLDEKLDDIEVVVSNSDLGTAMVEVLPDGSILVEYFPENGAEGN